MQGFDPVQAHFDLADHLASTDYFAGMLIQSELQRTLAPGTSARSTIDQIYMTITGKGAGVLVMMPAIGGTTPQNPLYFNEVTFQINVLVQETLANVAGGANKRAADIAANVAQAFHEWKAPGAWNNLLVKDIRPIRLAELPEEVAAALYQSKIVLWLVTVSTQMELPIPTKCATPTQSETTGTVTLTPVTSGSVIYYTIDGSYPGERQHGSDALQRTFHTDNGVRLAVRGTENRTPKQRHSAGGFHAMNLSIPHDQRQWAHEVLNGEYEPGVNLFNCDILDVGSNVGLFVVWASNRFKGARITCYEPMPKNLEYLRRNVKGLNSTIVESAVTSQAPNRVEMYDGRDNCGECSMWNIGEQILDSKTLVETVHPKHLPHCDMLKIDTEGCELDILEHYPHTPQIIVLEYHRDTDRPLIDALLIGRGYMLRSLKVTGRNRGVMKFWRVD